MGIGKRGILLTGFQHEGKGCQLFGASVEVNASEVTLEDVLDGLLTTIALIDIEVVEQVEALVEDMTRATS